MSAESTMSLSRESVLNLLRAIDDPEMPINIVDLGIVHDIRLAEDSHARTRGQSLAQADVTIDIIPTFVGCPALDMIRDRIAAQLQAAGAARVTVRFIHDPPWSVDRISPAGRDALRRHGISVPARAAGDACSHHVERVPGPRLVPLGLPPRDPPATKCPRCGGVDTEMESAFGPARCRMIYYCRACRSQFELIRRV